MTNASTYDGPLIDAHHHLWDLDGDAYPWLRANSAEVTAVGSLDPIRKNYFVADYLADVAGQNLQASVHVEALPENPLAEIAWLDTLDKSSHIADRYVAAGDPATLDFAALVDALGTRKRVVAIRSILSWHPEPARSFVADPERALDPAWRAGIAYVARRGLMLELMMYPYQAQQVRDLAAEFADLPIIINHCGSPIDPDEAGLTRWRSGLALVAEAPNVFLKVSNPGAYVPNWDDAAIDRIIRGCIDAFGYDRVIFGTDLPVAKLFMPASDVFRLARAAVARASKSDQAKFFYANAQRIYRLDGN
jgi:predicted TIM-barrel fold metal-dependent hydrolase